MTGKIFFLLSSLFFIEAYAALSETELENYLKGDFEKEASKLCHRSSICQFDYAVDVTNKLKEETVTNVTLEVAERTKEIWKQYFKDAVPELYKNENIKRQIKFLHILGKSALEAKKLAELTDVTNKMSAIYSTGKFCPFKKENCDLQHEGISLEPDIVNLMANSTNLEELAYIWKSWRDATGGKMKDLYDKYVKLSNEVAKTNNFSDRGEMWRFEYEDPNFIQNMDDLWTQVEPLYKELHTYVGNKLKLRYKDKLDLSDGLIPAHVLGNMWAQSWANIADIVRPFPNATKINVNQALNDQGYTVLDLFKKSDEFYQSLGLIPMGMCYNESQGAMIKKPSDGREVLCHASAWDFCDGKTYRVKMCTKIDFEDFITIHHEMGHIQYFLLYKDQPITFRAGANPGFHEAIGDTIALSVSTPRHLEKINLLQNYKGGYEEEINSLMDKALEKIAFLPFGLLIDKWRWDVFSGAVAKERWNTHWWEYRKKYQKVKAPVPRSDQTDFDPGAKYHVPGDSQYIAYFLAHILQFQFYKSLCVEAGQYDPNNSSLQLHQCDFYQSKAAGDKLRAGLSLGLSKHWSETLEILTGTKTVTAEPLLEYFKPLYKFLKEENKKSEPLGGVSAAKTKRMATNW